MKELKVIINGSNKTMSSVDIAKLTGKNHFDVLRDIRNTLEATDIDASKFACIETKGLNKGKIKLYTLPRRECDLVVSGYVPKYRLAIIDRWHEIETPRPMTLIESTRLLLEALEEKEALEAKIEPMQIKLDHHNCHATVTKGYGLQGKAINLVDAAKIGRKLSRISREHNITIYKALHERWGAVNSYHFDAWVELGVDLYECDKV